MAREDEDRNADMFFLPNAAGISGLRQAVRPLDGSRCLLVEDEFVLADVERRLLGRLGAEVVVAPTVACALEMLSNSRFDVVVADLGLPDGDGEVVLRRARELHPNCGLVVVSGTMDALRPQALRKLGVIVIEKHCDNALLGRAVQVALATVPSDCARETTPELPSCTNMERALSSFAAKYELSPQQTRMLALMTADASNGEISSSLGIKEETVRVQWHRVVNKLGIAGETKARERVLAAFTRYCVGERY